MNYLTHNTNSHGIREILIIIGFGFLFAIAPQAHASEITPQKVIELVNESRLSHGLNVVTIDPKLNNAAYSKASDMFEKQYFSHDTPNGIEPWYWIEEEGYAYTYAGENLAINFTEAEEQHIAWMESPTHRKNVLNPVYTDMGVAAVSGKYEGTQTIIVVQFFGQKSTAVIETTKNSPSDVLGLKNMKIAGSEVLEPKARILKDMSATFEPAFSDAGKAYDRTMQMVTILFILIVIADILILNYIQIRNIYPIIKELMMKFEQQQ